MLGSLPAIPKEPLFAAACWAVNPPSIFGYYSSDKFITEGLGVFLLVGAFAMMAKMHGDYRLNIACMSGLLLGLSILTRGYLLFTFPLCAATLLLFPLQKRWRTIAVFIVAAVAVIGGWVLRNWVVVRKPVLSTQTEHFYLGNNLWARGSLNGDVWGLGFEAPQFKVIKERHPTVMNMSEIERSEMWSSEAVRSITENPKRFAWLLMRKTVLFWLPLQSESISWYRWHYLYGFALLFVIPALVLNRWRKERHSLLFLLTPVIGVYIATLMTYSHDRYRFTIEPFVFLLGAVGMSETVRWLRDRRHPAVHGALS